MTAPIAAWRNFDYHYLLKGNRCKTCKKIHLPAVRYCSCGSTDLEEHVVATNGKLKSFTQVNTPPTNFKSIPPYCIGIIELEAGIRIIAQLTDTTLSELKINMPVYGVFRKLFSHENDMIHYGLKFIPYSTNKTNL